MLKASKFEPMPGFGKRADTADYIILDLRNCLAHSGTFPDDETCRRILEHYGRALEHMLLCCAFLRDCDLRVREGEWEWGRTRARRLRGTLLTEPELVEEEEWVEALRDSKVAFRVAFGKVFPLEPLLYPIEDCPVGLYDGHFALEVMGSDARRLREWRVYYLGTRERLAIAGPAPQLIELLEKRTIRWRLRKEEWQPWTIADALSFGSETTLESLRGIKYFPECFVERTDLDRWWRDFLTADDPDPGAAWPQDSGRYRKSGMVVVGEAGTGKTAWCCRVVEALLAEKVGGAGDRAWSSCSRNLVLFLRGDMIPVRLGGQCWLLSAVMERIGLQEGDLFLLMNFLHLLIKRCAKTRWSGGGLWWCLMG